MGADFLDFLFPVGILVVGFCQPVNPFSRELGGFKCSVGDRFVPGRIDVNPSLIPMRRVIGRKLALTYKRGGDFLVEKKLSWNDFPDPGWGDPTPFDGGVGVVEFVEF